MCVCACARARVEVCMRESMFVSACARVLYFRERSRSSCAEVTRLINGSDKIVITPITHGASVGL